VEDFPDEAVQHDLDLDDPYELLALYRSGSQIAPGVTKKTANDDDILMIFRRPLLDAWCESGEDLGTLIRHVMIGELGQNFDFSEEDIEEMISRHFQGIL
jgi:predicted Zn-dependent protease with MMP-like domain